MAGRLQRRLAQVVAPALLAASTPAWTAAAAVPVPKNNLPPTFAGYDADATGTTSMPKSVGVGDFTGDGRNDVVMGTGWYFDSPEDYKVFLFRQTASGAFARPVALATHAKNVDSDMAFAPGDVDGDGLTDLVVSTSAGLDVFLQRNGSLVADHLIELPYAMQVNMADFDGDGRLDIVTGTSAGAVILRGLGAGAFAAPRAVGTVLYTEIETGDVTGDGLIDIVGFIKDTVDVLALRPDGTYADPVAYRIVTDYWPIGNGIAVGDLNGDGRSDVAVSVSGNSPGALVNVFTQGDDGRLRAPTVLRSYEIPNSLVAADMNMDGRTDLVAVHGGWLRVGVYTQGRDGILGPEEVREIPYATSYPPKALAVGDFNGDGMPDIAVADYNYGLIVLRSAGQLKSWGLGHVGQLGAGSTASTSTPSSALAVNDVVTASAGAYHNVALTRDGRLLAWGFNSTGQLGTGSTVDRRSPTPVPGMTGVIGVAAGALHTLALRDDGSVWAWGWNGYGQLGLGTTTDRAVPARVPGLPKIIAIAGGLAHSLALAADGTVWAWGFNDQGELGTGTTTTSLTPLKVPGLTNIISIAAGLQHSLALGNDNQVWAWGYNHVGQLGTGSTAVFDPVARKVPSMYHATAIAAGAYHSVALSWDASVWTWGSNWLGQLGDGKTEDRFVPDRIDLYGVRALTAGWLHNVAVRTDGSTWAWGWNAFGQLGTGTTTDARKPVQVPNVSPNVLTAGATHTLVSTARGE